MGGTLRLGVQRHVHNLFNFFGTNTGGSAPSFPDFGQARRPERGEALAPKKDRRAADWKPFGNLVVRYSFGSHQNDPAPGHHTLGRLVSTQPASQRFLLFWGDGQSCGRFPHEPHNTRSRDICKSICETLHYRSVEKVFLVACLFYLAYFASAFLAGPDWSEALTSTVTPRIHYEPAYLMMAIGMAGAVIAPWMQFYQQSSVVEKGIKVQHIRQARWDVILGGVFSAALVFFIVVGCAVTLHQSGQHEIQDAAQAALALEPLAGRWASTLFAVGLCNASLLAASVLPLATAYYVCEGLGLEAGVNRKFHEAPVFYWLYTVLVSGGAGIVLIPGIPLIPVILLSQVVNGFLLPVVLIFIVRLSSRKDLMGKYRNHPALNVVAWMTVVVMVVLTLTLALSGVFPEATIG